MGLGQVVPGRYAAMIKDWGMLEVERLDGALEAWITFDFTDQSGSLESITWKGLIMTKAGDRNKNTTNALLACGLKDENDLVKFMDPDGLDMKTPVDITIIDKPNKDGSKTYKTVEWVNKTGEAPSGFYKTMATEEKSTMAQKLVAMGLGKAKPRKSAVKNHAPGAVNEPDFTGDAEIPF
jgi:hypothetical protein